MSKKFKNLSWKEKNALYDKYSKAYDSARSIAEKQGRLVDEKLTKNLFFNNFELKQESFETTKKQSYSLNDTVKDIVKEQTSEYTLKQAKNIRENVKAHLGIDLTWEQAQNERLIKQLATDLTTELLTKDPTTSQQELNKYLSIMLFGSPS